ncbi:DUF1206 domain-containing protein [Streptomyces sp. NPDC026092]|uniref:DUF1206 domain-containing protein n=1 Tax=Streptomyces sp. NPDC026092 TaxID=3154797 RepID=UPI0033F7D69B
MDVASRVGLCARGVIYVLVGIPAVRIGLGSDSGQEADRSGAVGTIGEQPFGRALLWALVVGLAAMTLWRPAEAAFGQTVEGGDKWGRRLGSLGMAVFYTVICIGVAQTALLGGSAGGRPRRRDVGGRVPWPALLPGAVTTMAGLLGLRVFSRLVFSPLIASSAVIYGPIGTVLVIQSWLVGVVFFGGALAGRLLHEQLTRLAHALKRRR